MIWGKMKQTNRRAFRFHQKTKIGRQHGIRNWLEEAQLFAVFVLETYTLHTYTLIFKAHGELYFDV